MQTLHLSLHSLKLLLSIYYSLSIILNFRNNAVDKTSYIPALTEITFLWEDKEGQTDGQMGG